jgi:hypothetical protein
MKNQPNFHFLNNGTLGLCLPFFLLIAACGGTSTSGGTPGPVGPAPTFVAGDWTWINGSNQANPSGVYGTKGTASATAVPGGRTDSATWKDSSGNFWLFSGNIFDSGYPSNGLINPNDLWEYNPATNEWAFMGGNDAACMVSGATCTFAWPGVYGVEGTAAAANLPGGRAQATTWTDTSGNFWLFGGVGFDSTTQAGSLNDLWKFNAATAQWTWVSGANALNPLGVYGTMGTAAAGNAPGSRRSATGWTDKSGNLWLFGGYGYGSAAGSGELNDLWEFNPSTQQWTWVGGADTVNGVGSYGTMGTAAAANMPPSRDSAASWIDSSGNFWLYGGFAPPPGGGFGDLWEFNVSTKQWTWVDGSSSSGAASVYGTEGTASTSNTPGFREAPVTWSDNSGNFWFFGGNDHNDLWEYAPAAKTWTWVSGSDTPGSTDVYGTEGVASATSVPGPHDGAVGWTDSSGRLWLFGGGDAPIAGTANFGVRNDLWVYVP